MLSVGARLVVMAALHLIQLLILHLLHVIIMNTATIALLFTMITVMTYTTALSVPGLGLRMTRWNGIHLLQPVGVSHRSRTRTRSLTQLIMNLEVIVTLCKTRIVTLLTV